MIALEKRLKQDSGIVSAGMWWAYDFIEDQGRLTFGVSFEQRIEEGGGENLVGISGENVSDGAVCSPEAGRLTSLRSIREAIVAEGKK